MSKKIININGAGNQTCQGGSWLARWEEISGRKQILCPEVNCDNRAIVGTLVQKHGDSDGRWYIIPLCWDHSTRSGQELEVVEAARLVPADSGEDCGAPTSS